MSDTGEVVAGKGTERLRGERRFEGRSGVVEEREEVEFARGEVEVVESSDFACTDGLVAVVVPTRPGGNLLASFSSASANFFPKGPNPNAPPPAEVVGGLISPAEVGGDPPLNVVELPPGEAARRSSPPEESASIPSTESGENERACEVLTGERDAFA